MERSGGLFSFPSHGTLRLMITPSRLLPALILVALAFPVHAQIHIDASGHVGMGVTPEGYSQLKVRNTAGTLNAYGIKGESQPTGATNSVGVSGSASGATYVRGVAGVASGGYDNQGLHGYAYSTSGNLGYGVYAYTGGSGTRYAGYFNGDVTVTGTFYNASDRRLKEDLQPLNGALGRLRQLRAYTYQFQQTGAAAALHLPRTEQIGLVAQEVEAVFPELVREERHVVFPEGPEGPPQETAYKTVNYLALIPVLIQAVQEQQEEIDRLRALLDRAGLNR